MLNWKYALCKCVSRVEASFSYQAQTYHQGHTVLRVVIWSPGPVFLDDKNLCNHIKERNRGSTNIDNISLLLSTHANNVFSSSWNTKMYKSECMKWLTLLRTLYLSCRISLNQKIIQTSSLRQISSPSARATFNWLNPFRFVQIVRIVRLVDSYQSNQKT